MRTFLLIAAAALMLPAGSSAADREVQTINLYSYGYNPKPIVLPAGRQVTLNFVNTADKGHDFTAAEFFRAARIVSGDVREGEIDLKGGESRTVTLIPTAGEYKAHCGHPFHSMFGMRTKIIVR